MASDVCLTKSSPVFRRDLLTVNHVLEVLLGECRVTHELSNKIRLIMTRFYMEIFAQTQDLNTEDIKRMMTAVQMKSSHTLAFYQHSRRVQLYHKRIVFQ